jgi:hypothetical protein
MVIGTGFVVACSGMASASSIIQTFALPTGSPQTNWTQSTTINTFNTQTGTLDDIRIIAALTSTEGAGATDASASGTNTYTISATTTLNLSDPSNELLLAPAVTVASTFQNQTPGQTMAASGTSSKTQNAKWALDSTGGEGSCGVSQPGCLVSGQGQSDPINYGVFESNGASTLSLTANGQTAGSFGGGAFSGAYATGTANVNVTVIYDYTAAQTSSTPEPASLALFGCGLVGIGLIRRKLKKS